MYQNCLVCGTKEDVIALQSLNWYSDPNKLDCSDQLHVILLLRKILKLRKSFLESLLRTSGQDPASWNLKLCKVCHKVFEEASFVSLRLCKLNQDFEELSESLRTRIVREDVEDNSVISGTGGKTPGRKRKAGRPTRKKACGFKGVLNAGEGEDDLEVVGLPFKIRKEVVSLSKNNGVSVEREQAFEASQCNISEGRESSRKFAGKLIKTERQSDVEDEQESVFEMGHENSMISEKYAGMPVLPLASTGNMELNDVDDEMDFRALSNNEVEERGRVDTLEGDDDWNETEVGFDDTEQMSDEDDSNLDSEYKPSSKRRRKSEIITPRRKKTRRKKINEGLIFTPKKIGNSESFRCPKCTETTYDTFELCKEHILHSHYDGTWPEEFACHLCEKEDDMKFKSIHWLKQHLSAIHPGGKLPLYERLDRFIKEGLVPELTYKVVPISKRKGTSSDEKTKAVPSKGDGKNDVDEIVIVEPSSNPLNVPIIQDDDSLQYLSLPREVSQFPEDVMKLLERDPEGKKCQHCGKCLPSEIQLQAHIKLTHEGEPYCYPCPLCPRTYERIGGFMEHLNQVHLEGKHVCEKCGQIFSVEYCLQAHIQRKHYGIMDPFKCIVCARRFSRVSRLNTHLIEAHQLQIESYVPERIAVGVRGTKKKIKPKNPFPRVRNGRFKLQETKSITCDICEEEGQPGLKFSNTEALDIHVKRTHMKISRPYSCTICEKQKYSTPAKLEKHMVTDHTVRSDVEVEEAPPPKQYICLPCGKTFKTERNLKQHIKGIYHANDRPHVCEICSQAFREISYLKHHQSMKHYKELNLTPNMCSFCGKILSSRRTLNDHIKTIHTKDARFKCPHCPQLFQYEDTMKKHVNVRHTKKDVFMCTQCPKQFFNNCNLRFHQIRVHSGTKPYECRVCSKKFSDKPTYNRHVEAHSNILHDCPHCGKTGFKTRHSLRVHVRTKHEEVGQSRKSQSNAGDSDLPGTSSSFPVVDNTPGPAWADKNEDVKYFVG